MQKFSEIYQQIKPSIVAIASKVSTNPEFPDIIGTGFIARQDGIILTNGHVIKGIMKLPKLKSMPDDEWPAVVLFFHRIPDKGMMPIPLDIKGIGILKRKRPIEGYNYGPEIPDLGFIHVHIKDLPNLKISEHLELKEGDEVMLSGFPMGTETLRAPGWLHQLSPTLQSGIISSILPFPCSHPHAILLNIMTQGGSSGSPVFNPNTGEVIGIEYAGIVEPKSVIGDAGGIIYKNNTSLTLAIPANVIYKIFCKIDEVEEFRNAPVSSFDTINSLIGKKTVEIKQPKAPIFKKIKSEDLIE